MGGRGHHSRFQRGQDSTASAKRCCEVEVEEAGETGGRKRKCHPCGGRRDFGVCARSQGVQHAVLVSSGVGKRNRRCRKQSSVRIGGIVHRASVTGVDTPVFGQSGAFMWGS